MVKTIITPDKKDILISIPENYIGKKIELIYYTLDEIQESRQPLTNKMKPSDFIGTMSKELGEEMQAYIKKSREEWERDF